jgi:hypothetical protein
MIEPIFIAAGELSGGRIVEIPGDRFGPFDSLLVSPMPPAGWAATAEPQVAVEGPAGWTRWLSLGRYGPGSEGSRPGQSDGGVTVDTDVVRIHPEGPATRLRLRVDGDAVALAVVAYRRGERAIWSGGPSTAWGRVVDVPPRSQMAEAEPIARRVCSPTSVAMVLERFGIRRTTADVAAEVYDRTADIFGHWPRNTAVACRAGVPAFVTRCRSLAYLEEEIAAGRPVVISHRWKPGDLTDAPIPESWGHLIAVVGFTAAGDVVVNDPAADPRLGQSVRRTYPRREVHRTWLENAEGIAYVFRPAGPFGDPPPTVCGSTALRSVGDP